MAYTGHNVWSREQQQMPSKAHIVYGNIANPFNNNNKHKICIAQTHTRKEHYIHSYQTHVLYGNIQSDYI